jgi:uncharacterized protein YjbI with pentapeptide repeats
MWYSDGNEHSLSMKFNDSIVEALLMRWLKRDMWKLGIALVGLLLFLVFMLWMPMSAGAYEGVSGLATPVTGTVQVTPTVNVTATMTALQEEKLRHDNDWFWNYGATLLSTLALFVAGIFALVRWFADKQDERKKQEASEKHLLEDRQAEREKRAEERFQSVIEGLGSTSRSAQVGAAIMLRTFLRSGYEQFYSQAFDLAVAHLRLRHLDPDKPEPLDSLSQALIMVFKEAFPRARDRLKRNNPLLNATAIQLLDATAIRLDNAYLSEADLKQVWMRQSYLRNADLSDTELSKANLEGASLIGANIQRARLAGADLWGAQLEGANLSWAKLNGAYLSEAKLNRAKLTLTDLCGAHIILADLREANLEGADLTKADLRRAKLNGANLFKTKLNGAELEAADLTMAVLRGANPEEALSLKDTNLREVTGLTKAQLEACKAKGAIIDEEPTTDSSQSPASTPPPSQSTSPQTPPAPPAQ